MHYLGLLLDNPSLKQTLLTIRAGALEIAETLSVMQYDSQYKAEGQQRGRPVEDLKTELDEKIALAKMVDIDLNLFNAGISDSGISDKLPQNKISALKDDYLNRCVRFSEQYRLNSLHDDLSAVFLSQDPATHSIRLMAVPLSMLFASVSDEALKTIAVTPEALADFRSRYTQDLSRQVNTAFSAIVAQPLDVEARRQMEKSTSKGTTAHGPFFAFYKGPHKAGCIISDEFNFMRGRNVLDLELTKEGDRNRLLHVVTERLGIGSNEAANFHAQMVERLPLPRKPHKRDIKMEMMPS